MKNTKGNGGITLIALVVTIIVLLILAGISIGMLSGNNGILSRSRSAKSETVTATIEEKVKLAQFAALAKNGGVLTDAADLQTELNSEFTGSEYTEKIATDGGTVINVSITHEDFDDPFTFTIEKTVDEETATTTP